MSDNHFYGKKLKHNPHNARPHKHKTNIYPVQIHRIVAQTGGATPPTLPSKLLPHSTLQ